MTDYSLFPALNATLNGASAVLITTGRALIARQQIRLHRACMIAAFTTSSVFLVSYLYYHAHVGSVHFPGQGWVRPVYFTILTSHTILASVVAPFVGWTLWRALKGNFDKRIRVSCSCSFN